MGLLAALTIGRAADAGVPPSRQQTSDVVPRRLCLEL